MSRDAIWLWMPTVCSTSRTIPVWMRTCYRLPRRLVYNIIRCTHCQQLFSIFFKKVVIYFKHTIYSGFHYIYIQVIYAFLLYYIPLLCLILSFLLPYMDCQLQYCCLVYLSQLRFRHLLQHYYL